MLLTQKTKIRQEYLKSKFVLFFLKSFFNEDIHNEADFQWISRTEGITRISKPMKQSIGIDLTFGLIWCLLWDKTMHERQELKSRDERKKEKQVMWH